MSHILCNSVYEPHKMPFTCPICLVDEGSPIGTLKPCKHRFHRECLRRWHLYAHDLQCPICRVESTYLLVSCGDDQESPVVVDLKKGFDFKNFIEYHQQEEQFLRRFNDALRLESPLSSRERLVLTQCNICGESGAQPDRVCRSCGTLFHESCLRSLACEVGDPTSWQQCVECRHPVSQCRTYIRPPQLAEESTEISRPTPQTTDELNRLREVKAKIQAHVRQELNKFYRNYGGGSNGSGGGMLNKIDKKHFTDINKQVSRKLYVVSNHVYQEGLIDYDLQAQREVRLELRKLGYTNV